MTNHCHFSWISLLMNILNMILVFLRIQWLSFILIPFCFLWLCCCYSYLPSMSCPPPLSQVLPLMLDTPPFPHIHVSGPGSRLIILLCFSLLIIPHGLGFIRAEGFFFATYIVHRLSISFFFLLPTLSKS